MQMHNMAFFLMIAVGLSRTTATPLGGLFAAPPPPAHQPAALAKLILGPENIIDAFGAGTSGGGERLFF
jgi:hypothetical protein